MKKKRGAQGAERRAGNPLSRHGTRGGAEKKQRTMVTAAANVIPVETLRPLNAGKKAPRRRKCPDCRYCQGCSQDRCRLCRARKKNRPSKLSMAEQIALYEKINRPRRRKPAEAGRV